MELQTPYFMIDQAELDKNVNAFRDALNRYWPDSVLAYSVKTNSLPWVLKHLAEGGAYAEAVSAEEYELSLLSGYPAERIIYNGPVKTEESFRNAAESGAVINLDSKKDLLYLERYGSAGTKAGIRVNIDPLILPEEPQDYAAEGMRFGFCEETGEFADALERVIRVCGDRTAGLHLHCSSKTRSTEVFRTICRYAAGLIRKYDLRPAFIDIGGGFWGGVPGKPGPQQYLEAIAEELKDAADPHETMLILEPGAALIGSAADYHISVRDVKQLPRARIVTTDGSRLHIDPLWAKTGYLYSIRRHGPAGAAQETAPAPRQVICGYTCMEKDRFMVLENIPPLEEGDEIVFRRVGPYTMTLGGMFIRYLPEVYVRAGEQVTKVRSRITTEEYYKIQS